MRTSSYESSAYTRPRSSSVRHRAAAMSLRPFTAPWAEADVAPWVPPATTGLALLLGTCATLLLAHGRAAQLRFNVRAPESTPRCHPAARANVQSTGRRLSQGCPPLRLRRSAP